MSISQEVGRYIPYLRRFSRALTGSRAGGDAYALAALETLVADQNDKSGKTRLRPGDNAKIVLYRLLLDWGCPSTGRRASRCRAESAVETFQRAGRI